MATSGTDTFLATVNQICYDGLTNVGANGPGKTPHPDQLVHAKRLLNALVKGIDKESKFLWRFSRSTFTTTASQASYQPAATVIEVDEPMTFVKSGETSRTTIRRITRDDYMRIADRTQESRTPTEFYVEKDLASDGRVQMTIYFWPVPSTSSDTIEYPAYLRGEDVTGGSQGTDFPQDWVECLTFGLTSRLAPGYEQMSMAKYYKELFEVEKSKLINNDNERGNLYLFPYGWHGGGVY